MQYLSNNLGVEEFLALFKFRDPLLFAYSRALVAVLFYILLHVCKHVKFVDICSDIALTGIFPLFSAPCVLGSKLH